MKIVSTSLWFPVSVSGRARIETKQKVVATWSEKDSSHSDLLMKKAMKNVGQFPRQKTSSGASEEIFAAFRVMSGKTRYHSAVLKNNGPITQAAEA